MTVQVDQARHDPMIWTMHYIERTRLHFCPCLIHLEYGQDLGAFHPDRTALYDPQGLALLGRHYDGASRDEIFYIYIVLGHSLAIMKISVDEISALPGQRLIIDFNENIDMPEAVKPCVGQLFVGRASGGYKVTGHIKTLLKLTCHTCLRPYFQQIGVELDELFAPYRPFKEDFEMGASREKELLKNDFYDEVSEDGFIDITDVVYQAVTLAAPVFTHCGADCPGPPRPENPVAKKEKAEEKAIDPRWKNLKTLFPNQE